MAENSEGEPPWKAEPVSPPVDENVAWGSDVTAQMLRRLGIPFIALTPGASYRGLHDSLVNHLGNTQPEMLLCLHEEHAVAIAHGYAKVTGRAMAVALHSNVGLMHATMAIFNAWGDRAPMLILGATGPMDATRRRPWIDWLHTAQDQAALIRKFVKWDDQPGSIGAIPEAMLRAWKLTNTAPTAPVYINLDAGDQEAALNASVTFPDPGRFIPPAPPRPNADSLAMAARMLSEAQNPVIVFGRGARSEEAMAVRVELAERLGAAMLSDLKAGAMVPTDHPLHACQPFNKLPAAAHNVLKKSDVILSLGWIDLGGLLQKAYGDEAPTARIIHAGLDHHLHRGWGQEHLALPAIDVELLCDADTAAADLLAALPDGPARVPELPAPSAAAAADLPALTLRDVAVALKSAVGGTPVTFAALARGWPIDLWPHRVPLDYLGKDGGGGVGSGPGLTIGAALALRNSDRMAIGVLGDGDTMMSVNALWTAAKYRLPALFIVANNRSYFNDELHQENVAMQRHRQTANAWIGQRIDYPAPDIAAIARALGIGAAGPIVDHKALSLAIADGVAAFRAGHPFLIDVHIDARQGREASTRQKTGGGGR